MRSFQRTVTPGDDVTALGPRGPGRRSERELQVELEAAARGEGGGRSAEAGGFEVADGDAEVGAVREVEDLRAEDGEGILAKTSVAFVGRMSRGAAPRPQGGANERSLGNVRVGLERSPVLSGQDEQLFGFAARTRLATVEEEINTRPPPLAIFATNSVALLFGGEASRSLSGECLTTLARVTYRGPSFLSGARSRIFSPTGCSLTAAQMKSRTESNDFEAPGALRILLLASLATDAPAGASGSTTRPSASRACG